MQFRNLNQCYGWIEPNLNVLIAVGGTQPFNSVACHYKARVVYKHFRFCAACMRDYDNAIREGEYCHALQESGQM